MAIKVPRERVYYLSSENEPDDLLCWIPAVQYGQVVDPDLADRQRQVEKLKKYYPAGLEVPVTDEGFAEFKIKLGKEPAQLQEEFKRSKEQKSLPQSGLLKADFVEQPEAAEEQPRFLGPMRGGAGPAPGERGKAPEPEMDEGEDPGAGFSKLSSRKDNG